MQKRGAWVWSASAVALCLTYQWFVHFYFIAGDHAASGVALLVQGAPHAAINSFLLWMFGRTLAPGEEPLVTAFALRIHPNLPPFLVTYTRWVTVLWCLVFAAQLI